MFSKRVQILSITLFTLIAAAAQGQTAVGIIPQSSSGCPVDSDLINLSLDDEDDHNSSAVSGWVGNIAHYSTGTTFGFCRVDGSNFHSHPSRDYVVLQL